LLVGEDQDFLARSGMINLIPRDGRISFETNSASLDRAGIRYSSNRSTPSANEAALSGIQM